MDALIIGIIAIGILYALIIGGIKTFRRNWILALLLLIFLTSIWCIWAIFELFTDEIGTYK